jgi:hypothetical protein
MYTELHILENMGGIRGGVICGGKYEKGTENKGKSEIEGIKRKDKVKIEIKRVK